MYRQRDNHRRYQVRRSDTHHPVESWELQRVVVRDKSSFNFAPLVYATNKEALEAGDRWVRAGN
ncbi:MAG: hypothetical protein ACREXK_09585 [Gammaproteobacteria bacterium]